MTDLTWPEVLIQIQMTEPYYVTQTLLSTKHLWFWLPFQVQSDNSNNSETADMLRSKLETSESQLRSSNSKVSSLQLEAEKSLKRVANLEEKISDLSKQLATGLKYSNFN